MNLPVLFILGSKNLFVVELKPLLLSLLNTKFSNLVGILLVSFFLLGSAIIPFLKFPCETAVPLDR